MAKRSPLCTVLVPFDEAGQAHFAMLRAATARLGFHTVRVAQYYSSGMILEEIVRCIFDAELVLADLSRGNPNVHYELGIAHALGKRVFIVTNEDAPAVIDVGRGGAFVMDGSPGESDRLSLALERFLATQGQMSPIDLLADRLSVVGEPVWGRRVTAFLIDLVLAGSFGVLVSALCVVLLPAAWQELGQTVAPSSSVLLWLGWSMTLKVSPGMRIIGLRVARLDLGTPTLIQRCLRMLVAVATLGVGFLWALRRPNHQAVHDMVTQTLVLKRSAAGSERGPAEGRMS